jgi:hypothetical protein
MRFHDMIKYSVLELGTHVESTKSTKIDTCMHASIFYPKFQNSVISHSIQSHLT